MRRIRQFVGVVGVAQALVMAGPLAAQAKLDDLEMAHVAVVASQIDIAYAKLALAQSTDGAVRDFAKTMIRDHEAVNAQVADLAKRLMVTAKDNAMSQGLLKAAEEQQAKLRKLHGAAFDQAYLKNELAYHRTVNGVVADQFIPNIQNPDVRKAFEGALVIFRGHEKHVEQLVRGMGGK